MDIAISSCTSLALYIYFTIYGYITNSCTNQPAQLIEHCTSSAEVTGSNPVQAERTKQQDRKAFSNFSCKFTQVNRCITSASQRLLSTIAGDIPHKGYLHLNLIILFREYFIFLIQFSVDLCFSPQVNGSDVSNVPQYVFFNMLRATDRVAKIQIRKIPMPKVG